MVPTGPDSRDNRGRGKEVTGELTRRALSEMVDSVCSQLQGPLSFLVSMSGMIGSGQRPAKLKDVPTLAKLLRDQIKIAHPQQQIGARPWNRFKPNQSLWWIIPSTAWPAYRHGKFFLTQDRTDLENPSFWDPSRLFLGLHVESGLSRDVASVYTKWRAGNDDSLVRSSDWLWGSFLADLEEGAVAEAARMVHRTTGVTVSVVVETSYPSGDGSDRGKWELLGHMNFNCDGYRLSPKPCTQPKYIPELKDVRSLDELREKLLNLARFQWVDLFLGVVIVTESRKMTEEQVVAEVWEYLAPWDKWFV